MTITPKLVESETPQTGHWWRGHLLLFDQPQLPALSSQQGTRLLLVFLFSEVIARPLFAAGARWLTIAQSSWWPLVQLSLLTLLVCWLVTNFAKVRLFQLGLYSWVRWSRTEKFYFLQILPIAIIVFSFFTYASLKALWARSDLWAIGLFIFAQQMIWGFYQELLYRGVLQTELVRRWGSRTGILVSNLVFTFGPLHAYHFLAAQKNPSHLWIFLAIFSIGLFFAILFKRSGNLWIIGVMHGLGDWFIDGLAKLSLMAR
jgi:membrane protease YdiL (CAAX protease family)